MKALLKFPTIVHEMLIEVATHHSMEALSQGRIEIDESADKARVVVADLLRNAANVLNPPIPGVTT